MRAANPVNHGSFRSDLRRRSVDLNEQDCRGVCRQAGVDKFLHRDVHPLVHHFHGGGHDPLGDDRADRGRTG